MLNPQIQESFIKRSISMGLQAEMCIILWHNKLFIVIDYAVFSKVTQPW